MKIDDLVSNVRDAITVRRVYAEPVTLDGVTVISAASVWGGGGGGGGRDQLGQEGEGGGFGLHARPVGAYVIKGDDVRWVPATDLTGIAGLVASVTLAVVLTRSRTARLRAKLAAKSS